MKPCLSVAVTLLILMTVPFASSAHDPGARDGGAAVPTISNAAKPAVAVVDEFAAALKAGDLAKAGECLATDVLILESGGAEHSREEYLGHHAAADATFLKEAQIDIKRRTAHVEGPLAWVGTESELRTTRNGTALTLVSTETTVLKKFAGTWRIVHIHWSSHPKQ